MSEVVKLMFVQFLISAASWTRIVEKQTHHLEWFVRFELTGQEWWPKAKHGALLATAHLSLQHTCPICGSLIQIGLPQKHSVLHTNDISCKLKVSKLQFLVLLKYSKNVHEMLCSYCLRFSFCSFWSSH